MRRRNVDSQCCCISRPSHGETEIRLTKEHEMSLALGVRASQIFGSTYRFDSPDGCKSTLYTRLIKRRPEPSHKWNGREGKDGDFELYPRNARSHRHNKCAEFTASQVLHELSLPHYWMCIKSWLFLYGSEVNPTTLCLSVFTAAHLCTADVWNCRSRFKLAQME